MTNSEKISLNPICKNLNTGNSMATNSLEKLTQMWTKNGRIGTRCSANSISSYIKKNSIYPRHIYRNWRIRITKCINIDVKTAIWQIKQSSANFVEIVVAPKHESCIIDGAEPKISVKWISSEF